MHCGTSNWSGLDNLASFEYNGAMIYGEEEEKMALFMKRIINFQQMIRYKGVLLRKYWRIINLLLVSGLQEDGPG